MNRNIEELYKIYCERFNEFSDTYADGLTDNVRAAYVSLLFSEYKKDLKCITDFEKLQLRAKNKLFKAALRAQRKLERERRPEVDYDDELSNTVEIIDDSEELKQDSDEEFDKIDCPDENTETNSVDDEVAAQGAEEAEETCVAVDSDEATKSYWSSRRKNRRKD